MQPLPPPPLFARRSCASIARSMISVRVVLFIAAAAAAAAVTASPPGLKLTLSQNCISYGKDWAIAKLLPSLSSLCLLLLFCPSGNMRMR